MSESKECCYECKFFSDRKKSSWTRAYFCTKDGTDYKLGEHYGYNPYAPNTTREELKRRCCAYFKERDAE